MGRRGLGYSSKYRCQRLVECAGKENVVRGRSPNDNSPIGIIGSGKLLNEENYLLNKLARQVLGTNHIDLSSNLYSASVVDGLLEATGLPAMSGTFDDVTRNAQSLFVIGSNLTEQHPVFGAQIRQAILRRKIKLIVASPDFINLAEYAFLPLYHQPNTETALLNGLMHIILKKGWEDRGTFDSHSEGYTDFTALMEHYNPETVAEITGLSTESLYQAAEILAQNRPTAILWSVGLADPATARGNVTSLVNLQRLAWKSGDLRWWPDTPEALCEYPGRLRSWRNPGDAPRLPAIS